VATSRGIVHLAAQRAQALGLSAAERFALAGIVLVVLLALVDAAPALEYRRDLIAAQPWRLLGAHLVHVNARHVLLNAVVWFVFARLFAPELGTLRQALAWAVGSLAIGAGLYLAFPEVGWYRGASGVLYTLYFTGAGGWLGQTLADAARRGGTAAGAPRAAGWRKLALPLLLVTGAWVKIIIEMPSGARLPYNSWLGAAVVPQAHLLGALAGSACAVVFLLFDIVRARPSTAAHPAAGIGTDEQ